MVTVRKRWMSRGPRSISGPEGPCLFWAIARLIQTLGIGAVLISGAAAAAEGRVTRRADPFIVHDVRPRLGVSRPSEQAPGDRAEFVTLNADVLASSADRIREMIYREFGLPLNRGGKIHLFLRSGAEGDHRIHVASALYADGWQYHLLIPDRVRRDNLVRALVEVVLLEFSNRGAGPKSAEIPLWLTEGISFHLLASVGPDLILEASPILSMDQRVLATPHGDVRIWVAPSESQSRTVIGFLGIDPIRETRRFLRENRALTFSELSDPSVLETNDENRRIFQCSSHLLFYELTRLPSGRSLMLRFLRSLPHYWNWQVAFLRSYHPTFGRVLDVEKWWSVNVTATTGRDPTQVWSYEVCLVKLEELLLCPAQVRLTTNALPVRAQVSLQEVISEWDPRSQRLILERVLSSLDSLRVNTPTDMVPLIDAHRTCLRSYWQRRFEGGSQGAGRLQTPAPHRLLVRQTLHELDELFKQREVFRRVHIAADPALAETQ